MKLPEGFLFILTYTHRLCDKCEYRTPHIVYYQFYKKYIIRQLQCDYCKEVLEEMVREEEME